MRSPKPRARPRPRAAASAWPDVKHMKQAARMWSSKHLSLIKRPAAATIKSPDVRTALKTLRRLRGGWRPAEWLLADACQAERWSVSRQADAAAYQFIGTASRPDSSSLTIATVLVLDPRSGGRFCLATGGSGSAGRRRRCRRSTPRKSWSVRSNGCCRSRAEKSLSVNCLSPAIQTKQSQHRAETGLRYSFITEGDAP